MPKKRVTYGPAGRRFLERAGIISRADREAMTGEPPDPALREHLEVLAEGSLVDGYQWAIMDAMRAVDDELEQRGMTRKELAERLEVHPSYVSRILNDPDNMTVRTLFRVCNALDLPVAVTVGEPEPKRPKARKTRRARATQHAPAK